MKAINMIEALGVAFALIGCAHSGMVSDTALTPTSAGTVTVTGRVIANNGQPVPNARVYIPGADEATRTDANGNYRLTNVPDGPEEVVVRARGYAPARTDAKFSTKKSDRARNHVDVTLLTPTEAAAVSDQQSRDSAGLARNGFLQRESSVRGAYFFTPEQVAASKAGTVSDLLSQVPVLVEVPGPTGRVLRGAQGCLNTYVDGLRWRSMFPGDLDTYIPVGDVVAAEVYPPGQLPPAQFARGAPRLNCTTLAIWTRSSVG
jgi:hypothetical protein